MTTEKQPRPQSPGSTEGGAAPSSPMGSSARHPTDVAGRVGETPPARKPADENVEKKSQRFAFTFQNISFGFADEFESAT